MSDQAEPVEFARVAVFPEPGDNAAIASRPLPAGTRIRFGDAVITLPHQVLEGHRFVPEPVRSGQALLSWNTPFAFATTDLWPGDLVCTPTSLSALQARGVTDLPEVASAVNAPLDPYVLDPATLNVTDPVPVLDQIDSFWGYLRADGEVGTRNHIAVIGLTSTVGPFALQLAAQFTGAHDEGFDGVVPVAHTEAGDAQVPNNLEFVLATLAGFCRHPNLGAVLLVDRPGGHVTAESLATYMAEHGLGPVTVPMATLSRTSRFADDLATGQAIIADWIPQVRARRTEQPASRLKIALQCGGSDAFSGVTANPLAGAVGYEAIRRGGVACLAETDELIGAEGYILTSVASESVAGAFLDTVRSFTDRVAWHGHTAEGNPSGGNIYRGLINIVLKSIGAGRKRDRRVRLDHVIGYAEPIPPGPGYVFMDSPGNDLESVAGQVASGCQLVFFTTGNGSITNFPFVPTLKFVTTTDRYDLLSHEMDVNAGRYLDGMPFEDLTQEVWRQTLDTASGQPTAGERAGHSQVSIWRDWKQTGDSVTAAAHPLGLPALGPRAESDLTSQADPTLPGVPVRTNKMTGAADGLQQTVPVHLDLLETVRGASSEQVVLILPTSLCAAQIAGRIADQASRETWHGGNATRVVALPHTEGCGSTSGDSERIYARTMTSYLQHPVVGWALLLEHGCEKTHNDYFRTKLTDLGLDPTRYGYASIQADGGIAAVTEKVHDWFDDAVVNAGAPRRRPGRLGELTVALDALGTPPAETVQAFARLGAAIVADGGTVVLSSAGGLVSDPVFRQTVFGSDAEVEPTLADGQAAEQPGWHVMRALTADPLETVTGLAATGAEMIVVDPGTGYVPGHRLVPVLRATADGADDAACADVDLVLTGSADERARQLAGAVADVVSGRRQVAAQSSGDVGFQITRGLLGTSL